MSKEKVKKIAPLLLGTLLFLAGCMVGRETAPSHTTLLHVFAFTPPEGATPQNFGDFQKATYGMVGKIPGLRNAWVGKLREPIPAENDVVRTYAAAMEFDNVDALNAYASHPVHQEWSRIYEKVRKQGTTTLDIVQ